MNGSAELVLLRLGLLAVLLLFSAGAALALRSSLGPRAASRPPRAPSARLARIVVTNSAHSGLPVGTDFTLAGPATVGRDDVNGIVLADPSVSGRHATILPAGKGWAVRDLGSTNGTFVHGRRLGNHTVRLRDGQTVAFGAVVCEFRS
jgi:hypothetical protein